MVDLTEPLTLGSASPRRSDLLAQLGVDFDVQVVDLDERALIDASERDPRVNVVAIAQAKFAAFPPDASGLLLTADTLVACNGSVMGKPNNDDHLVAMLASMSASELEIATAVCVGHPGTQPAVETVTTVVELRPLTSDDIRDYVATGVGADKAGGLALQAQAKPFIHAVRGCWSNVLGLPLCASARLLSVGSDQAVGCSVELCGSPDAAD